MTINEALDEYEYIKDAAGDPEVAHDEEDEFREQVLQELLAGTIDEVNRDEIIRIALATCDIDFPRWCA